MDEGHFELGSKARRDIAAAFLPSRRNYYYVRCKLAGDPLYAGVGQALAGAEGPILDLGCGLGLLAQTLAAAGLKRAYTGLDNDAGKIRYAMTAAQRSGLQHARFACVDLTAANAIRGFDHRGSVVILDLLQFVPPNAQASILEEAAACVADGGRLIIRSGLAGNTWRSSMTRVGDRLSYTFGWMNSGPQNYPEKESLQALLAANGLTSTCIPLWGKSPCNNWLIQADRAGAARVLPSNTGSK